MHDNKDNIDELFRENLENHEVSPSPEVWDRLSASLDDASRTKTRVLWFYRIAAASVLLLFAVSGWYLWSDSGIATDDKFVAGELVPGSSSKNESAMFQGEPISNKAVPSQEKYAAQTNSRSGAIANPSSKNKIGKIDFSISEEGTKTTETAQMPEKETRLQAFSVKLISPMTAKVVPATVEIYDLQEFSTVALSFADRKIIAANLAAMETVNPKRTKIRLTSIGASVSPSFSKENEIGSGRMMNYDVMPTQDVVSLVSLGAGQSMASSGYENIALDGRYKASVGAGANVEIKITQRLRIQTGLNYETLAKDIGSVPVVLFNRNLMSDSPADQYCSFAAETNSLFRSSGELNVQTSNGVVSVNLPEKAQMTSVAEHTSSSFSMNQKMVFIDLPIFLKYRLWGDQLGVDFLGGLNANFLVYDQAYLGDGKNRVSEGNLDGNATFTWGYNLGLGLDYQIGRRLNLSMQPIFKMNLVPIGQQSFNSDLRLMTLNLYTGIAYRF